MRSSQPTPAQVCQQQWDCAGSLTCWRSFQGLEGPRFTSRCLTCPAILRYLLVHPVWYHWISNWAQGQTSHPSRNSINCEFSLWSAWCHCTCHLSRKTVAPRTVPRRHRLGRPSSCPHPFTMGKMEIRTTSCGDDQDSKVSQATWFRRTSCRGVTQLLRCQQHRPRPGNLPTSCKQFRPSTCQLPDGQS